MIRAAVRRRTVGMPALRLVPATAALALLLPVAPAAACTVDAKTPEQRARAAARAVIGKVVSVRDLRTDSGARRGRELGLRVERVVRGRVRGKTLRLRSGVGYGDCGLEARRGERLGLILRAPRDGVYTVTFADVVPVSVLRRLRRR